MDTLTVSAGGDRPAASNSAASRPGAKSAGAINNAASATHLVLAGGPPPSPGEILELQARIARLSGPRVVAADSGLALADLLGLGSSELASVHSVLGDMDSVDPVRLAQAAGDGVEVARFPTDKDATDLELALDDAVAAASDGDRVVVVGTTSGRFDHVLAALFRLASQRYDRCVREAWLGSEVIHIVAGASGRDLSLDLAAGTTLSILPVHGDAVVTATGVRWPLYDELLSAGTSRGVSNVAVGRDPLSNNSAAGDDGDRVGGDVVVSVCSGTVMVVIPGDQPVTLGSDRSAAVVDDSSTSSTNTSSTNSSSTNTSSTNTAGDPR